MSAILKQTFPKKANSKLDVGTAVGRGTLSIIHKNGKSQPHIDITALRTGEIAEDLAAYFAESERIPTVCALGVLIDRDHSCRGAGGILIQLLPQAPRESVENSKRMLKTLGPCLLSLRKELLCLKFWKLPCTEFLMKFWNNQTRYTNALVQKKRPNTFCLALEKRRSCSSYRSKEPCQFVVNFAKKYTSLTTQPAKSCL